MMRLEGFIGEGEATAAAVAGFLADAGGGPVSFVFNSPGGDAFEGAAIYAELRGYPGLVTAHIRGIAASAASLALMGADLVLVDAASVLMIHDPSAMTIGSAASHRQTAATLDTLAATYASAYAARSGNRPADVLEWMARETWLTAEEAVALGFADAIDEPAAPAMVARADYTAFRHAPAELVALAHRNRWAAAPSERA